MGWAGICLATSLHFIARCAALWIYLLNLKEFNSVTDVYLFSKETSTNLGFQTHLGIMACLFGVWGWWAFDIFTLIGSYLSVSIISA